MSFQDEWNELKSGAKNQDSTRMQLNQNEQGTYRPGRENLAISASMLRKKAHDAETVAGQFMRADNKTMTETGQVRASLSGFECASAFDIFEERWADQMKYVKGLLGDGVAGSLRAAASLFKNQDLGTRADLDRIPKNTR